jgi:hypothetical protein
MYILKILRIGGGDWRLNNFIHIPDITECRMVLRDSSGCEALSESF